jgi:hypothetical protein
MNTGKGSNPDAHQYSAIFQFVNAYSVKIMTIGRYLNACMCCMTVMIGGFAFTACASRMLTAPQRWEGFRHGIFRVYVRETIRVPDDDEGDGTAVKKGAPDYLKLAAERARLIHSQWLAAGNVPFSAVRTETGAIVFKKCGDTFCEAFVDFGVEP